MSTPDFPFQSYSYKEDSLWQHLPFTKGGVIMSTDQAIEGLQFVIDDGKTLDRGIYCTNIWS